MSLDIAPIEARRSSNREVAMMRSRGWFASLATLASSFVSRTLSSMQHSVSRDGPTAKTNRKGAGPEQRPARRRRGGGGAWRAFVHVMSRGKQCTTSKLSSLAAEYRQLSVEEFLNKEAGEAATLAHRHGYHAFGEPASKSKLSQQKQPQTQQASLSSSAIIPAMDKGDVYTMSLRSTGTDAFLQEYEEVRLNAHKELQLASASSGLSAEEMSELQKHAAQSGTEELPTVLQEKQHSGVAGSFVRFGMRMVNCIQLEWIPPIKNVVQDRVSKSGSQQRCFLLLDCYTNQRQGNLVALNDCVVRELLGGVTMKLPFCSPRLFCLLDSPDHEVRTSDMTKLT